jgi:translation initiation factor 2 alpha subunit (eIF-2alpha)
MPSCPEARGLAMARKRKPDDPIALQVRMVEGLRAKLVSAAEKNGRSLNSEILWRLGQTFDEEWGRLTNQMEERQKRDQDLLERMRNDPELQKSLAEIIAKHIRKDR